MHHNSTSSDVALAHRVRACDYLVVAQLFLQSNFLLERPLTFDDVKPRLLGHWGTCHGINVVYANLHAHYQNNHNFSFILGPGHGYPALQANLYIDGELVKVDSRATLDEQGINYICHNFSWPYGFPSHSSPITPGVICEGGELGYALGASYGYALGHPERTVAVLIGDGEFETATTLGSLNLNHVLTNPANGHVLPILHLNGYKISGPTLAARKSERELNQLLRGFGYTPIHIWHNHDFSSALRKVDEIFSNRAKYFSTSERDNPDRHRLYLPLPPFLIYHGEKGAGGPAFVDGQKVAGNYLSHQIPLKNAKTDPAQLKLLSDWLASYHFSELFNTEKGFTL